MIALKSGGRKVSSLLRGGDNMPIVLKEIEVLCNADKRKSTNELPFVSAHMLHDLYLRWNLNRESN